MTRPREQAGPLCEAIAEAGGIAVPFPLLEIVDYPEDPAFVLAMDQLDAATLAVFISPNAVSFGLHHVRRQRDWPKGLPVAAVGQGTAKALREQGFSEVIVPNEGFDSEALLNCMALSADRVRGKSIVLFKGLGGRDLLADELTARGARVFPAPCYRRLPPPQGATVLRSLAEKGQLDAMVVSSSEAVRHLGDLLPGDARGLLKETVMICSHPRIAEAARQIGCTNICMTSPGDAGILAGLSAYNWPSE